MESIDQEPPIIKEFRELYDYVRLLGQHVKLIHNRLEQVETLLTEINTNHSTSIQENAVEIASIREHMARKVELNEFVQKMKASLGDIYPPLPPLSANSAPTQVPSENIE
jgi:DNA anti-recombination protein RmuC